MSTAVALRLGPADHGRPLTLEEYLDAEVQEGYRYELAKGVLEVTEVPNDPHGDVVCNLLRAVRDYEGDHPGIVRRFGGAGEFRLWLPRMVSGRNPDLAVVLKGAPIDNRGRRVPALAAEVVSEGTESEDRDYRVKREEYLAFGLGEYWVVDRFRKQVTLLIRDGDQWLEHVLRGDQIIASQVLPGFVATVASLWVDVEEDGGA